MGNSSEKGRTLSAVLVSGPQWSQTLLWDLHCRTGSKLLQFIAEFSIFSQYSVLLTPYFNQELISTLKKQFQSEISWKSSHQINIVIRSPLTLSRTFHVTNAGASLPSSRISTAALYLPLETGMNTWILMQGIPPQCKLLVYRAVWSRVFSTKASIQGPASVANFRYSNILGFLCFPELLSGNCSLCILANLPPHFQLCQSVPFGAFFFLSVRPSLDLKPTWREWFLPLPLWCYARLLDLSLTGRHFPCTCPVAG